MNTHTSKIHPTTEPLSRRDFLRSSSLAAAGTVAAVSFPSVLHAQTSPALNAVVIGLGGRGGGAGRDFLEAAKNLQVAARIVAVADIFPNAARRGRDNYGVPEDRCYSGFDAYKKAIETPGVNYVILATPPGFRPPYFKAAIEAGKHVFMEKPVAVDGPGCRIMYEAYELAKQKNLKVAAGTQRRHESNYIETIKRIQDGTIGDLVFMRAYWVNGGPIWHRGDSGATDLQRQIHNWYHYIWLSGDHICEQHVHNLDVCNWVMGNQHPTRCWGMGARQMLDGKAGEIWDNFAVEYEYAGGVRMYSYCGQVKRSWSSVSEAVHGTKGFSNPGGSISVKGGENWRYRGKHRSGYVQEHMNLIDAIRNNSDLNEAKNVTDSTLTAILGREAAYSGSGADWDTVLNSKFKYGPDLLYTDPSKMEWGSFRTLKPPLPSLFNTLKDPPMIPTV
ncbi:MAG: Gfo/Idh/MocA family oxidoreductase [Verrucomicrobia bacterium]|nr:Gfo/Idh/MocA family oxidoreductase [Verrucomicrobiota bacterium]